jgi:hypothetical protein
MSETLEGGTGGRRCSLCWGAGVAGWQGGAFDSLPLCARANMPRAWPAPVVWLVSTRFVLRSAYA